MTTTTSDPHVTIINAPINNGKRWYMCNLKNSSLSPSVCVECKSIIPENWEYHKRNNPNSTFYSVPNFVPDSLVPTFIRRQMSLQVELMTYPDAWEDGVLRTSKW